MLHVAAIACMLIGPYAIAVNLQRPKALLAFTCAAAVGLAALFVATGASDASNWESRGYAQFGFGLAAVYLALALLIRLATLRLERRGWSRASVRAVHIAGVFLPLAVIMLPVWK